MSTSNHHKKVVEGVVRNINDILRKSSVTMRTKYKIIPVNGLAKAVCSKWIGNLFKIKVETEIVIE